jgi:segregation and condensation protein A
MSTSQETNNEYLVRLDVFEGPLDLLLYLVTKAEVEITDINISAITKQYLEYLDLLREVNIDIAGEYLHMAATLLRLKSRELLPYDQLNPQEALETQQEGGIYNKEQLIQQLLEYKKFKEAAQSLKVYEAETFGTFGRGMGDDPPPDTSDPGKIIGNVTIFDLISAFKNVLTRDIEEEFKHVVKIDNARIDDRIEHIVTLLQDNEEIRFEDLFKDDHRRVILVVTFMAILELVKMQQIQFRQEQRFGGIFVSMRPEATRDLPVDEDQEEASGAEGRPEAPPEQHE